MQDGPRNKVVIIVELAIIYLVLFKCFMYSKYVAQLCSTLCDLTDYNSPWNSPDQNTGVGSHCLLQGIFPTQESNPGLSHCRRILYQLSHQGSPRVLEWSGSLSLFQQIFPIQESNQGLLHCRWILYQLSYQRSLHTLSHLIPTIPI